MKLFLVSAMTSFICVTASALTFQPFDVINPIGDENLGTILVKSPQDPGSPAKQIAPFNISGDLKIVLKADEVRRVTKGSYCVVITPLSLNKPSKLCDVKVEAKKTTTVAVSALKVVWDPSVIAVDVGPQVTFRFVDSNTGFSEQVEPGKTWMAGMPYSYWPLLAGTVKMAGVNANQLGEYSINVLPGETHTENVNLPDIRASVEVLPPQRSFPDPTELNRCNHDRNIEVVQRNYGWNESARFHSSGNTNTGGRMDASGSYAYGGSVSVDWNKGGVYRFFPKIDENSMITYELVVNNTWMPLRLQVREKRTVQLKRIDVNDVLVSREDGTTFYTPGKYKIFVQDAQAGWKLLEVAAPSGCNPGNDRALAPNFTTKSGIDVLPGVYKVVTEYTTQEGPQVDEQVIDLR